MQKDTVTNIPKSPLAELFDRAIPEKQNHYRKEWLKFFTKHRTQFYKRVKKPQIIDLALWQIACDELIFEDRIIKHYEVNYPEFQLVEVFEIPEKYIREIEGKFNL